MRFSEDCRLPNYAISQDQLGKKRPGADHLSHGDSSGAGVIRAVLWLCQCIPSTNGPNHCAMDQFQMGSFGGEAVKKDDGKNGGKQEEEEEEEY